MYTKCQEEKDVKEEIIQSFRDQHTYIGGWLQIVIATIAFGMRLDCPDIRYVSSGSIC